MTILSSTRGREISLKFECDGWAVWESILLTAWGYSMAISHLCSFFFTLSIQHSCFLKRHLTLLCHTGVFFLHGDQSEVEEEEKKIGSFKSKVNESC